jgi:type II secretory pathway component PulK
MKKNSPSLMQRLSPGVGHRARNSQALILVLAVMVLISALMVGFLLSASSGRVSASNYSITARTRQLADLAVNMVQAQINQAIYYSDTNQFVWASQPGARHHARDKRHAAEQLGFLSRGLG